ncbi:PLASMODESMATA CALLOSE-BINDING PROTEIN 3 like [Actinidia chinensis var. chinensis]|uniref:PLASMODESMATA CALLOSE-BINDING PROTEIN 3 like n=1 Tax=Actinidia chinensis var. chinensis TaxID=1590841 RepID=A0A2R6PBK1_ACTCC|nr:PLASMODESMATA CALLOSE-BINDING PROTEIN 3 like [Actinidia chinensis var. chinensis]
MAVFPLCLVLFLAMAGHSSATYCVCKDNVSESILQKNIDYACGAGADCSAITSNGACYNPNTVKDHCNYAVNSYYQKKQQAIGSCDFQGSATTTQSLSSTQSSGCVYPASPSGAGNGTTPSTSTTPSNTTPTGSTTTTPSGFGLGPSGTITNTDSKASLTLHQNSHLVCSLTLTLTLTLTLLLLRL